MWLRRCEKISWIKMWIIFKTIDACKFKNFIQKKIYDKLRYWDDLKFKHNKNKCKVGASHFSIEFVSAMKSKSIVFLYMHSRHVLTIIRAHDFYYTPFMSM